MANKRIKDLGTTASTLAADDYVAIDGNANGTRKIVKGDLVNDISTQVAGTYLDEANNLSDVASKDTSKLNLEVPDVGTAPNEVPMNGQLGSMAYQSAEAVSAGTVSADDVSVGNVGSGYSAVADELIVGDEDGSAGMTIVSGSGNSGNLFFADGTTSSSQRSAGKIVYNHSANQLQIGTVNSTAVTIDSSQRVGIGTSSPSSKLFVNETAGNAYITVTSGDTNQAGVLFGDQTDSVVGGVVYNNNSDQLQLRGSNNQTRCTIDSSGRVGIGNTSPGSYSAAANNLVVGSGSGSEGITIATGAASEGGVFFADGTSGADAYRGAVIYKHSDNSLRFSTNATTRWQISSAGHLISNNGLYGIDFGSGDILDTYEEGTFTPELADVDSGGNVATTTNANGYYTRVGNLVHITLRLTNIVTTGMTTSNRMRIRNLPFDFDANLNFSPGSIIVDGITYSGMIVPTNVGGVGDNILTLTNFASGGDTYVLISAISSGTADIYINMSYTTDEA